MKRNWCPPRFAVAALAAAVLFCSLPGLAQEPAAAPAPDEPAAEELREQSIYIPYEKLRKVFEQHGRGVFLPYEQFQDLWDAARKQTTPPAEAQPPLAAVITGSENEARVAEDVVEVKARLTIELLSEGWHEVPLRLSDAAITRAPLDDAPARLIGGQGEGYRLLIEKKGKQPEEHTLELEYAKAIQRTPGQNRVSFQAPRAPISRWRVTIPQAGVKVNIQPLLAATEVPAAAAPGPGAEAAEPAAPEQTVVLAFVGAAPVVGIEWTPKSEGAAGLEALASVQAEQRVWFTEGATRTRTRLDYAISRAELSSLRIEVPADQRVVNVADANVRQWTVEEPAADAKTKEITVQLFEPAKGSQQVFVDLEQFAADAEKRLVHVPVVKAVGVGHQQGELVIHVDEGLRAEVEDSTGLLQVDAGDLSESLSQESWAFSYRYASALFALTLAVEKLEPQIVTDSLVAAYLEPERLSVDTLTVYTIRQAGVFRLDLDVPAGFEVVDVVGREGAGAAAAVVDGYHLEGSEEPKAPDDEGDAPADDAAPAAAEAEGEANGKAEPADTRRLVVNLSRKAFGRVALVVLLTKELDEPGLRSPEAEPAALAAAVPTVAGPIQRAMGRLVVYAPESLRITPEKSDSLRTVTFREALEGMPPTREQPPDELRPVLAFGYTQAPGKLALSVERRRPKVTMRQLLVARIDSGVIKYEATFHYQVRYSGVESLLLDVPKDVDANLPSDSPLRHEQVEPGPNDPPLPTGYVRWELTGESELLGEGDFKLSWETPIEGLDVGQSKDLSVPRLLPAGVDRAWGQIVLAKAETLDIEVKKKSDSLLYIDPQTDLVATVPGAARALEFQDDWDELTITLTHYKLEEVKHTCIELGVVRAVATRGGTVAVQGLYRVRSAQQQLQVAFPNGASFDTSPVRIGGRRVPLQTLAGDYFVPLVDSSAEESFLLELRYTIEGSGSRLDVPWFPEDPAVLKLYLAAYLPDEWALLGSGGPWTPMFEWRKGDGWRPEPVAWADPEKRRRINAERLIAEVVSGINDVASNPAETFRTDGTEYLFSTLHPEKPPGGSLRLRSVDDRVLSAIVFALVALGGLVLLPVGISGRAMATGSLVALLVLGGVFLPTLTLQILDVTFLAAICLVLVLWVVWFFWRTLPQLRARPAAVPVEPPPAPHRPVPPPESFTRPSEHGHELKNDAPPSGESPPAEPRPADPGPEPEPGHPTEGAPPARKARPKDEPPTDQDEGGQHDA